MNNIMLRQNVIDELEFEPSLNSANIGVAASDTGVITLTGFVSSYAEKTAAEHAARRVKGVHGIAQEIEIRYPNDRKGSDDQIAERALKILSWDTTIPDDRVQVKVENGWVTLSGEVQWYFQKASAENAVHKLSGVMGVTNEIRIANQPTSSAVKAKIEDALKRSAEVDARSIKVLVSGSNVTLEGNVNAWHERNVAERAAWAVPGVLKVYDHLTVS